MTYSEIVDVCSAEGEIWVRLEPGVNARNMKGMSAIREIF